MSSGVIAGCAVAACSAAVVVAKKREIDESPTLDKYTGRIEGRRPSLGGIPLRVTFINGILNSYEGAKASAEMISTINGGCRVDFVADPSQGAVSDLFQAAVVVTIGATPEASRRLVSLWRKLLKEMDTEQFDELGQSRIIHFAHSRGGIVSTRAMELLNPEERERIVAHYFGSPSVNAEAMHHVSSADIVPSLSPHPLQNIINMFLSRPIQFQGEVRVYNSREPSPYIRAVCGDHSFKGPTYRKALEELATCITEQSPAPSSREEEQRPIARKDGLTALTIEHGRSPITREDEQSPVIREEERSALAIVHGQSPFAMEEEQSSVARKVERSSLAMEDELSPLLREDELSPLSRED